MVRCCLSPVMIIIVCNITHSVLCDVLVRLVSFVFLSLLPCGFFIFSVGLVLWSFSEFLFSCAVPCGILFFFSWMVFVSLQSTLL